MRLTGQDYERLWSKAIEAAYLARLPEPMVFGQMVERAVLEKVAQESQRMADDFIASMHWSDHATTFEKELVLCNVQGFKAFIEKRIRTAAQEGEDGR